jgi:hypothetical protein
MLVAIAIFFNFHSADFLPPYSLFPAAHPIAAPRPHFGDINNTDHINMIQLSINTIVNSNFIVSLIIINKNIIFYK